MLPPTPQVETQETATNIVTIGDDDQRTLAILNETIAYISLLTTLTNAETTKN